MGFFITTHVDELCVYGMVAQVLLGLLEDGYTDLQIRGNMEDNPKVIFFILLNENTRCAPH